MESIGATKSSPRQATHKQGVSGGANFPCDIYGFHLLGVRRRAGTPEEQASGYRAFLAEFGQPPEGVGMTLRPFEGKGRVFVRSKQNEYLADLDEFDGIGWCGCKGFEFGGQKTLSEQRESTPEGVPLPASGGKEAGQLRCKHLRFARLALDYPAPAQQVHAERRKLREGLQAS